jgi:hypothetical protein
MVDEVTEKPTGRCKRSGRFRAFEPYNLKTKPAADSLQVQRVVTYRTTASRKMLRPVSGA